MTDKVRVSIILTSYNHAKYLRQAIESVLNQTFTDYELIIWDDASTDDSWEIINSYQDRRIRAFRNVVNLRGNISRGLEVAQGEYVAIHHSDDAWEPTKLEKQVSFLDQNPDIAAVFTHVQVIDEEGQPFTDQNHFYYKVFEQPNRTRFEWLNFFFYHGNALCHPSVLIRKECYKEVMYRKGLVQISDFDFWIQLCLNNDIFIIQEKLTRFRVRASEANVSGNHRDNRVRGPFEFLKALEHYKKISTMDELTKIFPEAYKYVDDNYQDRLYALGRLAIDTGNLPSTKLFGLNLLFEALNDHARALKLQKFQGFDRKVFYALTAENDVFSIERIQNLSANIVYLNQTIQQLNDTLAERDHSIQQLNHTLAELEQEVLFYATSKSWKITRPLRKVVNFFKRSISKASS